VKDYILEIKVRNGPLLRAMRDAGFHTQTALAEAAGVSNTEVGKYLNLKRAPLRKNGEWPETILRIAAVLKCDPWTLFPERHLHQALEANKTEVAVSFDEIETFIESRWRPETIENHISIQRALAFLTERERKVIKQRFGLDGEEGEWTFDEIANTLPRVDNRSGSLQPERIRQIEARALRKLRHPHKGLDRSMINDVPA